MPLQTSNDAAVAHDQEPDAKRLKLSDSPEKPVDTVSFQTDPDVYVGSIMPKDKAELANTKLRDAFVAPAKSATGTKAPLSLPRSVIRSVIRPVSPPPTTAAKSLSKPDVPVPLMPRKLNKEPATFTKRVTLLKALHTYMKPHNDKMLKAVKPEIKALHLTPNQLNKAVVDEEEQIARANPSVYENVLKQRLVRLKTMTPEVWVKERREAMAKESGDPPKKAPPKKVDTGLAAKEEVIFLSMLNCPQTGLDAPWIRHSAANRGRTGRSTESL